MRRERLVILDGNSLMYRAFFAMPDLTNSEGIHTNAVYGFINMLLKIKSEFEPDHIVVAFDKKAPTFRHKEYDEYKAGRKKMPEELVQQIPFLREFLQLYSINIFEIDGFEADDLIGTLSVYAESENMDVYIVTGDRDALQLATDNVKIVINKKGITDILIYDREKIIEELGVTPKEFIDVKGLMGDKSDNIKGVPGIGEKTAYKLIQEYKSIENVLENIDNLKGNKLKENLRTYREQAIFSKKLATIITDVPVEIDLDEIRSKENLDLNGIEKLFARLQFKNLFNKLPETKGHQEEIIEKQEESIIIEKTLNLDEYDVKEISTEEQCEKITLDQDDDVYITYGIDDYNVLSKMELSKLVIAQGNKVYSIDFLSLNSACKVNLLSNLNSCGNLIIHNAKPYYTYMRKCGIDPNQVIFDTEIAAYLIDPGKKEYDLSSLVESLCHIVIDHDNDILKLVYLKELHLELKKKIDDLNMDELFYEVELPLTYVISSMEYEGFRVDNEILQGLGEKFSSEIDIIEKEIFTLAGEEFNVKSPKQLGKILFEKLDLPIIKKTKTGYSTNIEVLEQLKDKHEIIDKIIYHRQLVKLYSTYVEGLKNVIDIDGKIHSNFNQTITTTGRLSSTEPNLQNIPIKYEMGREIRKVFVPEEESLILSADYSQIELRVLAHISGDNNLIEAFKHHSDIHSITASEVFGVPLEEVTKLMRSNAKAVNFGIVYGIGDFSLAKDLNISRKEAKNYIEAYFARYPKVKEYLNNIVLQCKEELMVTTILNRRRFIPEIGSSKKMMVAFGERLAMNTPIQGSAADIIKLAMVKVFNVLKEKKLKSKLILQVHDELILNVCKDELEIVKQIVHDEMENAMKLDVPLETDMNIGENWYEAK